MGDKARGLEGTSVAGRLAGALDATGGPGVSSSDSSSDSPLVVGGNLVGGLGLSSLGVSSGGNSGELFSGATSVPCLGSTGCCTGGWSTIGQLGRASFASESGRIGEGGSRLVGPAIDIDDSCVELGETVVDGLLCNSGSSFSSTRIRAGIILLKLEEDGQRTSILKPVTPRKVWRMRM